MAAIHNLKLPWNKLWMDGGNWYGAMNDLAICRQLNAFWKPNVVNDGTPGTGAA
jgi:hypothetical protein